VGREISIEDLYSLALPGQPPVEWHTDPMGRQEAPEPESGHPFRHETLLHIGDDGFLDGALPFIEQGLEAEEPIFVAVSRARIDLLREALGRHSEQVRFEDMKVLGSNPARIIPAWRRFLAEHSPDERPARGIGEPIWAGRSHSEVSECHRHEWLLNVAFGGGQSWRLLCPYDLEALDEAVIDAARHSHPFLAEDGGSRISDAYVGGSMPNPLQGALPAPATPPAELAFTAKEDLGSIRWFVSRHAHASSLDRNRADDFVLAVNELVTNSLRHGGGAGTLRIWTERDALVCEVRDRGQYVDPLFGRVLPAPERSSGRGLWVVNQLCDLVQIRSSPAGTAVRVHMRW
jgi:anti-sigma regulatory factor (Ser/Thr protein kinase)